MKQNNTKTQLGMFCVFVVPRIISVVAFLVVSFFSLFSLFSSTSAHATSLTLSVDGEVLVNAAPTDTNGVFTSSASNISVSTNNYTGYTLGISASTISGGTTSNSNALKNTLDSSITIPSVVSQSSR